MACYAADLTIRRNNTIPAPEWQFAESETVLFPLTGSVFILSVFFLNSTTPTIPIIALSSADDGLVIDYDESTVTWPLTLEESLMIPPGRQSTYTLDRLIDGTRQTFVSGTITGAY